MGQPKPKPAGRGLLHLLVQASFVVGGVYITYKVVQALTDDVYDSRTLPASVRYDLIDDHIDRHGGAWCPGWGIDGHWVDDADLCIDHILPWAAGGRTSVNNSQVLCRGCNAAKGATVGLLDHVRGR